MTQRRVLPSRERSQVPGTPAMSPRAGSSTKGCSGAARRPGRAAPARGRLLAGALRATAARARADVASEGEGGGVAARSCPAVQGVSGTGVSGPASVEPGDAGCRRRAGPWRRGSRREAEPTCGRSTTWSMATSARRHVRLVGEDVEAGAQDRAGLQRLDQRRLVDDAAARDVDEDALRPERLQHLRVDDPVRLRPARARPPGARRTASARPSSVGW